MFVLNHTSEYLFFVLETMNHGVGLYMMGYFCNIWGEFYFENKHAPTYLDYAV